MRTIIISINSVQCLLEDFSAFLYIDIHPSVCAATNVYLKALPWIMTKKLQKCNSLFTVLYNTQGSILVPVKILYTLHKFILTIMFSFLNTLDAITFQLLHSSFMKYCFEAFLKVTNNFETFNTWTKI